MQHYGEQVDAVHQDSNSDGGIGRETRMLEEEVEEVQEGVVEEGETRIGEMAVDEDEDEEEEEEVGRGNIMLSRMSRKSKLALFDTDLYAFCFN
jgi:hypothetical protein